jgi:hypothetical protein
MVVPGHRFGSLQSPYKVRDGPESCLRLSNLSLLCAGREFSEVQVVSESSEGTGKGGRNDQRGVFGNGGTSDVARGPVNRETGALGGFSLRERHRETPARSLGEWSPARHRICQTVSERPWGSHTADGTRLAAK